MRSASAGYIQKRTINPKLVHLVCDYLNERNFDFGACRKRQGSGFLLPLSDDGAISFNDFLVLLEVASRQLNDDALAIKIAQRIPFFVTGLHHYIVSNAPNLGAAVKIAAEFTGLVTNSYATRYDESGSHAWIVFEFRGDAGPLAQFVDLQICTLVLRARHLADDPGLRLRLEFEHQAPKTMAEFHALLGTDLKFGSPVTRAGFHKSALDRVIPGADPLLFDELVKCGRIMLQLKQREKDIAVRVAQLVSELLPSGNATPEQVARGLGLSERTLQRELAAANTTFTKIVEDTRKRMSQRLLLDTELPLTEIAHLLGYSELSAFSRAARHWFGQPPTSIRQNKILEAD